VVKEGDNADLVALDYLTSSFDAFLGPIVLCGVAEPHDLLTSAELIAEQKRIERALGQTEKSGALPHYSEGVASLVLERASSARARGCAPAL